MAQRLARWRGGHCRLTEHSFPAVSCTPNHAFFLQATPLLPLLWLTANTPESSLPHHPIGNLQVEGGPGTPIPISPTPLALSTVLWLHWDVNTAAGPKPLAGGEQGSRRPDCTCGPSLPFSLWVKERGLAQIHKQHIHGTLLTPRWVSLAVSGSSAPLHSGGTWRRKLS